MMREEHFEQNFVTKAGAQRYAAEYGVAIVAPDTSPRKLYTCTVKVLLFVGYQFLLIAWTL